MDHTGQCQIPSKLEAGDCEEAFLWLTFPEVAWRLRVVPSYLICPIPLRLKHINPQSFLHSGVDYNSTIDIVLARPLAVESEQQILCQIAYQNGDTHTYAFDLEV